MHDARDEEDRRLLEAGDHSALVRSYYETIIQRCNVRCRTRDDALECAQSVAVRLLSELKRGKQYSVPFRVVVHKVIEWTTKGCEQVEPGAWSMLASEHYGRIVEPDHLQRSLDILRTLPPIDQLDGWLEDLEAESAAMPDHARQRLFDEWFATAYEEIGVEADA